MDHRGEWFTAESTAEWLQVPVEAVRLSIKDGSLPALTVGGHLRISRDALLAMARGGVSANGAAARAAEPQDLLTHLPAPAGFAWVEALSPIDEFVHGWPQHGGGYSNESYPEAWGAKISIRGQKHQIKVGRASGSTRTDKRPRLTVFMDLVPLAEFIPTADGSKLASVIKPNGKKTISSAADLPPLYRRVPTAPYSAVTGLAGMGRPKGLALLIEPDDLRSAVHHGAARRLGRLGEPLVPAD